MKKNALLLIILPTAFLLVSVLAASYFGNNFLPAAQKINFVPAAVSPEVPDVVDEQPTEYGESEIELLQFCPDLWVSNRMPLSVGDPRPSYPAEYFIVAGERRELIEFDIQWVQDNCSLEKEVVW